MPLMHLHRAFSHFIYCRRLANFFRNILAYRFRAQHRKHQHCVYELPPEDTILAVKLRSHDSH
jgi:hypothetical protein